MGWINPESEHTTEINVCNLWNSNPQPLIDKPVCYMWATAAPMICTFASKSIYCIYILITVVILWPQFKWNMNVFKLPTHVSLATTFIRWQCWTTGQSDLDTNMTKLVTTKQFKWKFMSRNNWLPEVQLLPPPMLDERPPTSPWRMPCRRRSRRRVSGLYPWPSVRRALPSLHP